jgi:hypothetical protein
MNIGGLERIGRRLDFENDSAKRFHGEIIIGTGGTLRWRSWRGCKEQESKNYQSG